MKFYENPSCGSRVVQCGRKDMTKLIVAFRSFVDAPNEIEISDLNTIKDLNLNLYVQLVPRSKYTPPRL
jgi:hypothetical protein